ncbi:MAG: DsbC family protein [bacterium]|nr:DsbC family protein [bacterium]
MNCNRFLLFAPLALFILALTLIPSGAAAFGNEGCGERACSDCHSINIDDTSELLKDIVMQVHAADFAEVPGLFVVDITDKKGNRGIIYMDFSRSYILFGNLVVMGIADGRNVSRKEMMKLRKVDLTTVSLADSVVLGKRDASKKVILFTDPKCPYCEKLHPELKKVVEADPDIVFFIKMMPLVKIHPESYDISRAILCEGDITLLEDSFAKKPVPPPTCESDAVDRSLKLAQSLGISSTPTMILPDGRISPGYLPAEELLKLINGE